jgi:uncharacterized membrane protein
MNSKISAGTMSAFLSVAGGFVRAAAAASAVVIFSVGSTGPVGVGLLGIAGVLSAYSQVAYAGNLTICNNTRRKLDVAIAYNAAGGDFVSKGWWGLNACGGCLQVLTQGETTRYDEVYLRAEFEGTEALAGRDLYCVDASPFQYKQTSNCSKKGFTPIKVDLNKKFTFNIGPNECGHL